MSFHVDFMCITILLILFEIPTSYTQFPQHIDLQKIGDVDVNGNKYNLLKPTKHTITDYFKHFMLGEIRRYPNEKVFIDDNGFKHDWSYFYENSRKHYIFNDARTLKKMNNPTNNKVNKIIEDKAAKDKNKVRKKPRRKKKITEQEVRKETIKEDDKTDLREGERTVATTTFFCPFFGVITMSSYLD